MVQPVVQADEPSPDWATLTGEAEARCGIYRLLARVFRAEMDKEFVLFLRNPATVAALAAAGCDLDDDVLQTPASVLIDTMAVEYSALFLGPGGHIAPYESVQIVDDGGGSLNGPETVAVARYLEAAGFVYDGDYHGLPDHIGIELEFLASLTATEAQAWQNRDAQAARNSLTFQRDFMDRHLSKWAGKFFDQVIKRAEHPFYRAVSALGAAFLSRERTEVKQRLKAA